MAIELAIKIKDDERMLKKNFLIYEDIKLSVDDPTIKECLAQVLKEFQGDKQDMDVIVNAKMVVK